jgi:hypothetical protein
MPVAMLAPRWKILSSLSSSLLSVFSLLVRQADVLPPFSSNNTLSLHALKVWENCVNTRLRLLASTSDTRRLEVPGGGEKGPLGLLFVSAY